LSLLGKPLNDFGEWGALSNKEQNEMLGDILKGKYPHLSNLILIDYTPDQEKTNGLFAYAFKDGNNPEKRIFAFRGTEGSPLNMSRIRNVAGFLDNDWQDNLYTGTKRISLQFDPAKAFVDKNMGGGAEIFVTGHSKGAGIASYIAATRPDVQGKSFDGPGIGLGWLRARKSTAGPATGITSATAMQLSGSRRRESSVTSADGQKMLESSIGHLSKKRSARNTTTHRATYMGNRCLAPPSL
jgi:hypothetical protein